MEPIEEETEIISEENIEMNSEEERCPSSKGDSDTSEVSKFDAATELDDEGNNLAPISEISHDPGISWIPDPCIPYDLAAIATQVCPNISISAIPRMGFASSSNASSNPPIENAICSNPNDSSFYDNVLRPAEIEKPPLNDFSASNPTVPDTDKDNLNHESANDELQLGLVPKIDPHAIV
ncbi:hypothetical protein Dimus_017876 [Dionaea muscipula]